MLVRQSVCTEDWVAKLSLGLSFSCCFPVVAKYVEISCLYVIVVKQILIWWLIGVKKLVSWANIIGSELINTLVR